MIKTKFITITVLLCTVIALEESCKKYLDEKSDMSLAEPTTVKELRGILQHPIMSAEYAYAPMIAVDVVKFSPQNWSFVNTKNRDIHLWEPNTDLIDDWQNAYFRIKNSNVVLSYIDKIQDQASTIGDRNLVKGEALFYRAFNWWELSQLFSPQPAIGNLNDRLGVPLKTSADVEDKTVRSTIKETCDKIIADLKESAELLPRVPEQKHYPSKAASYGLLARTYLQIGKFDSSIRYAGLCLKEYSELIDYNNRDLNAVFPFEKLNPEVIFHATARFNSNFSSRQTIDTALINLYAEDDLRIKAFFKKSGSLYSFKGSYSGSISTLFTGIATDEIYLIRSESLARLGFIEPALNDLNTLLQKRWKTGTYVPYIPDNPMLLLKVILLERRKELVLRNLRFSDLRRLNADNSLSQTIQRNIDGKIYTLPPNDLRYTFLIPPIVIEKSGIQQNPR